MKKSRKIFSWRNLIIGLLALLVVAQLGAKYYLGLGDIPVYISDPDYEYIYAPNQRVYRMHNLVQTNEWSMRSKPVSPKDRIRILKFGDSVINGGAHVDQDNLCSTILENTLSKEFSEQVRVLNISAQSWGPDNAFAYLKKHGNFGAGFFVLVFSSHDLYDNMHFKRVVGEHKAWPAAKPWCALTDGFNRYLVPRVKSWFGIKDQEYDYLFNFDDSKINAGWQSFFEYADRSHIGLLVYLHPTLEEIDKGAYNKQGQQLIKMFEANGIQYLRGMDHIRDRSCYRDNIHLNEKGHKRLSAVLLPGLSKYVQGKLLQRKTNGN